ncbi:MAG: hypothetical protein R3D55_02685 [Chloroflexota bacterium]
MRLPSSTTDCPPMTATLGWALPWANSLGGSLTQRAKRATLARLDDRRRHLRLNAAQQTAVCP